MLDASAAGISDATCCVFASIILAAFWLGMSIGVREGRSTTRGFGDRHE
jgi:hypothetical protein